jgi:hypothetical protein
MKNLFVVLLIIAVLVGVIALGFSIHPKPFTMPDLTGTETRTIPLPAGLPAPVERFYRTVYGDQIPVIDSVVIIGRGRMRPFGIWLPARFVIIHETGRSYRHYFEATFFGLPILKVNEGILDGESYFESPMGTYYNDANTNQGANLALWAEAGWFPSLWVTDQRLRWEGVDDNTALLYVPYEDQTETFVVRFDPQTGLIAMMEAMRYRNPGDTTKILWITSTSADGKVGFVTWLDQGHPWAEFGLEAVDFNLDVRDYIRARGR